MPLFKHLWVAKELLHTCANFRIISEKEFGLLTPKVGIVGRLEKCCDIQVIQNCEEKNGCILSSTGRVNLSFGFNDTI